MNALATVLVLVLQWLLFLGFGFQSFVRKYEGQKSPVMVTPGYSVFTNKEFYKIAASGHQAKSSVIYVFYSSLLTM